MSGVESRAASDSVSSSDSDDQLFLLTTDNDNNSSYQQQLSSDFNNKEELLLYASRHGDVRTLQHLLALTTDTTPSSSSSTSLGSPTAALDFNINCRGKSKSNYGWTPLHLATYFGHQSVVELLLRAGANVNDVNDAGDTALHKAAFIGREDLVLLLLKFNASVSVFNAEGQLPRDVARVNSDICQILDAAHAADAKKKEEKLLSAARQNDLQTVNLLLKDKDPPNINCTDALGNTSLHCAAHRGHKEIAVLFLQNGIDSTIKNARGQLAMDLTRDPQMQQVLSVKPVRQLQRTADRFEGQLLKRSRFLGWKPIWAVLERGVLIYYNSRGDGSTGMRKDFKYLDGARVVQLDHDDCTFVVYFSDTAVHRLSVVPIGSIAGSVARQRWMQALNEHIAYNNYYIRQGRDLGDSSDEDDEGARGEHMRPLGTMKDSLQIAQAHCVTLEKHVTDADALVTAMGSTDFPHDRAVLQMTLKKYQDVGESAKSMLTALNHCVTLFSQQEELRNIQLRQEQEKCRVLEEALRVLAKEHHELEQSLALQHNTISGSHRARTPRFYDTSDDEFYDAFEPDNDSDTLVTATGNNEFSPNFRPISRQSSCSTLVSTSELCQSFASFPSLLDSPPIMQHSFWDYPHRTALPVPMFSRNDFSIWSVLKNCIGKELSKITMPIIFNEPLSFLQRMVEYMEYGHLLTVASEQSDPIDRMKYIAAFAVSALASNWERLGKPFNPLLGETYELQRPGYRIICEQVSHHPPISAFHADSKNFIFHGSINPKLKFWGKSVEIQPKGQVTVELPKWGEAYTWSNVNCCVHNIIVGKLWIEQYGTMEVINHATGHRCVLTFKPAGWFSKDLHRVEGHIIDTDKKKLYFLYGKWTDFLKCTDQQSFEEYFKDNAYKFAKPEDRPDPNQQTPKKVLAKLNSLKMPTFKSQNSQAEEDLSEPGEADVPKSDSSYSIDIPNSVILWKSEPRPENSAQFYHFTKFAMTLNEINDSLKQILCPTDSRLRPDIRLLECGSIDEASSEKTRLEEKQREARKIKKSRKSEESTSRWFTQGPNPHTKVDDWLYSGGYWDRNYENIPDIF